MEVRGLESQVADPNITKYYYACLQCRAWGKDKEQYEIFGEEETLMHIVTFHPTRLVKQVMKGLADNGDTMKEFIEEMLYNCNDGAKR